MALRVKRLDDINLQDKSEPDDKGRNFFVSGVGEADLDPLAEKIACLHNGGNNMDQADFIQQVNITTDDNRSAFWLLHVHMLSGYCKAPRVQQAIRKVGLGDDLVRCIGTYGTGTMLKELASMVNNKKGLVLYSHLDEDASDTSGSSAAAAAAAATTDGGSDDDFLTEGEQQAKRKASGDGSSSTRKKRRVQDTVVDVVAPRRTTRAAAAAKGSYGDTLNERAIHEAAAVSKATGAGKKGNTKATTASAYEAETEAGAEEMLPEQNDAAAAAAAQGQHSDAAGLMKADAAAAAAAQGVVHGMKYGVLTTAQREQVEAMLCARAAVLPLNPKAPAAIAPGFEIDIETGDAKRVRASTKGRRFANAELDEMGERIAFWLKEGIVTPSTSPWCAPLVAARKKDGSLRLCVDFRGLNAVTQKDAFVLPRIDDILTQMDGAGYFQ
jgi:hypothetical protein